MLLNVKCPKCGAVNQVAPDFRFDGANLQKGAPLFACVGFRCSMCGIPEKALKLAIRVDLE